MHRARRRRARPAAGDDPLALSARALHAAVRAGRARARGRLGAGARRRSGRRPWPGSRAAGSIAPSGCSTPTRPPRREELLGIARVGVRRGGVLVRRRRGGACSSSSTRGRRRRGSGSRRSSNGSTCPRARPSSAAAGPSSARSARACSRRSRSWPPGTATSICVAVGAERRRRRTATTWLRYARTRRSSGSPAAERAVELVRETWRAYEEFNLQPKLALEALLVQLRRELAASVPTPA